MLVSQHRNFTESDQSEKSPVLFLLFMLVAIQVVWVTHGPVNFLEGEVVDTDGYMRLNRVLHLAESGDWFNSTYPRSNAPFGEVQHWTRPMDLILVSGAALAAPFLSFPIALHWWGMLISPLFQVFALLSLIWLAKPLFERDRLLILGGIFVLQPGVIAYYLAGRVDHHGILLLCFIALLGCTFRMWSFAFDWKVCMWAGISAGLGIWVSIEFMVGLFVSLAFLSGWWVVRGEDLGKRLTIMMVSLWVITALALLIERNAGQLFLEEYDRYSIVHWVIFSCLVVFWVVVWLVTEQKQIGKTFLGRAGLALVGALGTVGLMWTLFPKFFQGPLVDVDPRMVTLLWERITETQPLISTNSWKLGRSIFLLGIAIPAIPYLGWLIWKEKDSHLRGFWLMIGVGVLVYLPLTLREVRWVPYAELLLVLPYAQLVHQLVLRYDRLLKFPWQGLVKAGVVLVGALGFVVGGSTLMKVDASDGSGDSMAKGCPLTPLSKFLNDPNSWGDRERTILAFVNFGPELLYRTPHRVVATPYHRNGGVIDTHRIMSDTTGEIAEQIVNDRQINLILVCPASSAEPAFYTPSKGEPSFYDLLHDGKGPDWVEEIILPPDLSEKFKLFSVLNRKMS